MVTVFQIIERAVIYKCSPRSAQMLKFIQSFAILAVVVGLMSGCSTNKEVDETPVAEPEPVVEAGIEDTGVEMVEEDILAGVSTTFYFEFDSAVLNAEARAALIAHAEVLRDGGSARLEGHADERGSREYNMALGERRAIAVRDFLVVQGVSASQLETISYGEENPAEMGGSEYSWSKNRRVELSHE